MQDGGQFPNDVWPEAQLPGIVQHIVQVLREPSNRLVIAASPGCQELAAAAAVRHAVQNRSQTPYAALLELQQAHHLLKVTFQKALSTYLDALQ